MSQLFPFPERRSLLSPWMHNINCIAETVSGNGVNVTARPCSQSPWLKWRVKRGKQKTEMCCWRQRLSRVSLCGICTSVTKCSQSSIKLLSKFLVSCLISCWSSSFCSGKILLSCCMLLGCKWASFQFEYLPKPFLLRGIDAELEKQLCHFQMCVVFVSSVYYLNSVSRLRFNVTWKCGAP